MVWEVPWSLSLNYSVSYGYGQFNKKKLEYDGRITQNLSLSGNIRPTKHWNFGFTASYNFDTHKLAYMNCNISRDLHCFTMTASFVPVGLQKLQLPYLRQFITAAGSQIRQTLIAFKWCELVLNNWLPDTIISHIRFVP